MKSNTKLISTGVLTAIASSLCCITPILGIIAGTSSMTVNFNWIEPFRPYFIGLTILILGLAWYQKLKNKIECNCESEEKPKFIQTKMFLGIITVFALIMMTFPYYSDTFYSLFQD